MTRDNARTLLGPIRTLVSIAVLLGCLWFAFCVDLGGNTLAQHVDRISETNEAQALIDGTRARVNPALEDVKDRVLGEVIEAPTHLDGEAGPIFAAGTGPSDAATQRRERVDARPKGGARKAPAAPTSANDEPALPGR